MWIVDDLRGCRRSRTSVTTALATSISSRTEVTRRTGGLHDELRLQRVNAATGALDRREQLGSQPAGRLQQQRRLFADKRLATFLSGTAVTIARALSTPQGWTARPSRWEASSTRAPRRTSGPAIPPSATTPSTTSSSSPSRRTTRPSRTWWDCYAQRVRASDGALLGSNITISATYGSMTGNGDVAYDSDMNRYLVIYEGGNPSPWVQFVSASGTSAGLQVRRRTEPTTTEACPASPGTPSPRSIWPPGRTAASLGNFARRISQTGAADRRAVQDQRLRAGLRQLGPDAGGQHRQRRVPDLLVLAVRQRLRAPLQGLPVAAAGHPAARSGHQPDSFADPDVDEPELDQPVHLGFLRDHDPGEGRFAALGTGRRQAGCGPAATLPAPRTASRTPPSPRARCCCYAAFAHDLAPELCRRRDRVRHAGRRRL